MADWHLPQKHKGKTAFINARLFDAESGLDEKGALLVEDGLIADFSAGLFKDGVPEGVEVIDCGGHLLTPGLIDIQVHFREPGQEHKETLETGSKAAVAGGVTTVVCQPNTRPVLDSKETLSWLKQRAAETAYNHIRVYAAISKDMKGHELTEMATLKESGIVVGFTDDGLPVMNSLLMRRAMEYASQLGLVVAQHAEDIVLSNGGCMNEGAVSADLGVRGICNATESIIVARDIELLRLTGGHYHLLHASTKEAVELIRRAKAEGLNATAEACPHHFLLTDEAVREHQSNAKMNPPLRREEDRLAIIEGLKDGTIDAISTDHAPHDPESKRVPLEDAAFGIIGVETMLPLSLLLVARGELSLRDVIGKMTYRAADIIKEPAGRLKKGLRADLAVIDVDATWTIEPEKLNSKSKNTPFGGWDVKGRAVKTVVGGSVVYLL